MTVPRLASLFLALCLWGAAPPAARGQVETADYAHLARVLDGRITFETLPHRDEPGFNLNAPVRIRGAWLGERFLGQTVTGTLHDILVRGPSKPLRVKPGQTGHSLSVARHRGFGSNALFPLGPRGFPDISARGEGATAVLFDRDQAAFGLLIHASYPDPLGIAAPPGNLFLSIYTRNGRLIAATTHQLGPGINDIALRRSGEIPDIAGFTITNSDPGGIAIDDIVFQLSALTG